MSDFEDEEMAPPDQDVPLEERPPSGASVLVFRNGSGEPVVVPDEVATAAERAYRCYKHHLAGKSWAEIAVEEQYPSADAVAYDVKRYMEEAQSLVVHHTARQMLGLEVARLDALQSATWGAAMAGHIPSATFVLNVIKERSRLVGLDPEKMAEENNQNMRTVVVPHDSAGYIAGLQRAAEHPS